MLVKTRAISRAYIITMLIAVITASSAWGLTLEDERQLGKETSLYIRKNLPLISDPLINQYITNLGYRLVSWSNRPSNRFQFFVINDSTINAFAMFGGVIGVYSGLINASETESELAAVMAHEVAHDTQRHLAKLIESLQQQQKLTIPAIIGSILLGVVDPNLAAGALSATVAGVQQSFINYTRENELEADSIGMQILYNAHYDPYGMPNFFQRLQQRERFRGGDIPEFLRSHPITEDRISTSQQRAAGYELNNYKDSLTYRLMKQRLHIVTSQQRTIDLVRSYENQLDLLEQGTLDYFIIKYGYALALVKQGKYDQAYEAMLEVSNFDSIDYYYQLYTVIGMAEILLASGNNEQAIEELTSYTTAYPNECSAKFYLAKAYANHGEAEEVLKILNDCAETLNNEETYLLLANAYNELQQGANSYYAIAQASYLKGNNLIAIEQLKMALCREKPNARLEKQIKSKLNQWDDKANDFQC